MRKHKIYIGTSGWAYKHWMGRFYPTGTKIKDRFPYYIEKFNTVEINNTFYGMPLGETFLNWKNNTPDNFLYVIKANKYITHNKKLHDPQLTLPPFLDLVKLLGHKLGPVLFQLPPLLKSNTALLENFLKALPKKHRFAFEFRNTTWYQEEVFSLLEKYNCAFCIYELAGHTSPVRTTADFVYLRLHGPGAKYQGNYSEQTLRQWADQALKWAATKDVFIYFDNDQNGYAAFNALKLLELISA